jgi:16S rRNA (guanine966-N2)-methyltransferase
MAGGRLLQAPKGLTVRPTPDLVRQAVFNSLGSVVDGAAVLDLFSGTGALGLECLSRGASRVVSVELSGAHARYIRENVLRLGLPKDRHELRVQDVFAALRQLASLPGRFDLVMADPPFGPKTAGKRSESASQRLMEAPELGALLAEGGFLVLGHARRDGVSVPDAWEERRVLEHGDSVFRMLARRSVPPASEVDQEST